MTVCDINKKQIYKPIFRKRSYSTSHQMTLKPEQSNRKNRKMTEQIAEKVLKERAQKENAGCYCDETVTEKHVLFYAQHGGLQADRKP